MNRRSFTRWLGLAPIAAAAAALAAKTVLKRNPADVVDGSRIAGGSIRAEQIRTASISATKLAATDANPGLVVAGNIRSADGRFHFGPHNIEIQE